VWGVWAGLLAAGLALAAACGRNVPFQDEWEVVPEVAGARPVTPAWLWAQHNDHRIPLPKLLLMLQYRLSDYDLRVGMVINALGLAVLAAALVGTARKVRGRTSYADAFFPLMLLHWGHFENLLFGWQIAFILSTMLAGAFLMLVVRQSGPLRLRTAALAGGCLVLLPLCGANGVALVPAFALWLAYAGLSAWRSGQAGARRVGMTALALAGAGLVLVGLYFHGLQPYQMHPPSAGPWASLLTAVQFLSAGFFGVTAVLQWPRSGVLAVVLLLATAAVPAWVAWKRPAERLRALGLLAVLAALVALASGLGWGRSGVIAGVGFAPRYLTLPVPIACALYFVCVLYGPPRVRRLGPLALLLAAAVLLVPNMREGRLGAVTRSAWKEPFERDLLAGAPPLVLGEDHSHFLYWSEARMAEGLRMLQRAGVGRYRDMRPDPAFREVALPTAPAGTAYVWGGDSYLPFTLPRPRFVYAVRITYSLRALPGLGAGTVGLLGSPHGPGPLLAASALFPGRPSLRGGAVFPGTLQVAWKEGGRNAFSDGERVWRYAFHWAPNQMPPRETTRVVWVNDTIDQFRIHPDNKPVEVTISEVVLLVPAEGEAPSGG
jgi:hypothetical protein